MRSLLPLTVYCISLVSLQQLLALPVQERPTGYDLFDKFISKREDKASVSERQILNVIPSQAPSKSPNWLPGFLTQKPAPGDTTALPSLVWARPDDSLHMKRRVLRARRHTRSGTRNGHHNPHHAQLMRVGCVLGTCQVQNLSHRLYQLIGQRGREDSSPINPRSPHSYG